jgi:peptidoglycan/xylan/chitin deacetylase (PgdA/CDA1 family)
VVEVQADPLVPVRIASIGNRPRAAWCEGLHVRLPSSVLARTGWRGAISSNGDLHVPPGPASISASDVATLRERRAFTDQPPASARLPFRYHAVPGWMRALIASAIGRWNAGRVHRWAAFPAWPIDVSADVLDDLRDDAPAEGGRTGTTPIVVTHDIDSPEGLTNLIASFLPIEEAAGARSTNYVVPCAWAIDHGRVAEAVGRGHEVGVHGFDHGNTTPFVDAAERARRLDAARAFADRYGATGYRAPSLLRTRPLLRDLAERYQYDSSIPTSGGLFPTPNNGCATTRPFRVENIVELPVTLPRDGTLRFLGHTPDDIVGMWIQCADLVARARGVVVLLTHCERRFSGEPGMLEAYRRFLEYVGERPERFSFSTPTRVLAERFSAAMPSTRASSRTS